MRIRYRHPLVAAPLVALAAACAGRAAAPATPGAPAGTSTGAAAVVEAPAPRQAAAPFAPFRTQPMVVAPVQRLRGGDELGWSQAVGDPRAYLAALDGEIAAVLAQRGVTGWTLAADVERAARRNPTVAPDPHRLAIEPLLVKGDADLAGPLAGQLRAMVALGGQRYVLVPAELRFARLTDGRGQAVLHLALVDTRLARRLWTGEIRSDPADTFSRALLAGVAGYFADLIAPRDDARPPGA
jgi:hypothetical protein